MESVDEKLTALEPKRILAADDELKIVQFIKVNLERRGYEVDTAANGVQALAKIRVDKPDLLITDVMMPEMDGFELLTAIRRDAEIESLPVLIMIAKASYLSNDEEEMKFLSQANFIEKPFTPDYLGAIVDEILGAPLPIPQGKRLLVVEDVPKIAQIITSSLSKNGYAVETAENGLQALAKIKANLPDLLITDMNMPEMSGLELIDAIRRDTTMKDLPVLLMTTRVEGERYCQPPDVNDLLSRGANQVIHKPFGPAKLLVTVTHMLSHRNL